VQQSHPTGWHRHPKTILSGLGDLLRFGTAVGGSPGFQTRSATAKDQQDADELDNSPDRLFPRSEFPKPRAQHSAFPLLATLRMMAECRFTAAIPANFRIFLRRAVFRSCSGAVGRRSTHRLLSDRVTIGFQARDARRSRRGFRLPR